MHQVGVGVLGPVFRTYDPEQDRLFAVKAFHVDITPEQADTLVEILDRLVHAELSHRGLVVPVATGLEDGVPFLAQEYVAAESLDVAMRHYAPASLATTLPLVEQLAEAVDTAHRVGVCHGGLHLRDVFLTPEGGRLTGFGVVPALEEVGLHGPIRRPYTAPEMIAGRAWGPEADRFALAAIAYELLTGKRAAGAGSQVTARLEMVDGVADVEALQSVFASGLADAPDNRYATATRFASDLRAAVGTDFDEADDLDEPTISGGPSRSIAAGAGAFDLLDAIDISDDPAEDDQVELEDVEDGPVELDEVGDEDLEEEEVEDEDIEVDELEAEVSDTLDQGLEELDESEELDEPGELVAATDVAGDIRSHYPEGDEESGLEIDLPLHTAHDDGTAASEESDESDGSDELDELEEDNEEVEEPPPVEFIPESVAQPDWTPEPAEVQPSTDLSDLPDLPPLPQPQVFADPYRADLLDESDDLDPAFPIPAVAARTEPAAHRIWLSGRTAGLMVMLVVGAAVAYFVGQQLGAPSRSTADAVAGQGAPMPGGVGGVARQETEEVISDNVAVGTVAAGAPGRGVSPPASEPELAPEPVATFRPPARSPTPVPEPEPAVAELVSDVPVSEPEPAAASRVAPVGWLLVRTTPPGANVTLNGVGRGQTPLSLRDVPFGSHRIEVSHTGFLSQTRDITVSADGNVAAVGIDLLPVAPDASVTPALGSVAVESRPEGARVILDGQLLGMTPTVLSGISVGSHQLRLERDGYRAWVMTIDVPASDRMRVAASLDHVPR